MSTISLTANSKGNHVNSISTFYTINIPPTIIIGHWAGIAKFEYENSNNFDIDHNIDHSKLFEGEKQTTKHSNYLCR